MRTKLSILFWIIQNPKFLENNEKNYISFPYVIGSFMANVQ